MPGRGRLDVRNNNPKVLNTPPWLRKLGLVTMGIGLALALWFSARESKPIAERAPQGRQLAVPAELAPKLPAQAVLGPVPVPPGKSTQPAPSPASTTPAEPYPGPDRRTDPIGWLSWKLDRKREMAMDRLLRACPEAKPLAGPIEDLYRQTYGRLVTIAAQGKAGDLGPDEFRAEEKRIADSFKQALHGQMGPVVKSEPCYALLRAIDEERMSR